ncbi:sugar O-acyltransferase, sialic acid O-acetyltransferase NeuD family [Cohnella sp. OV330]|uniref:NeuD/PglB/VioB family sugar acetyltransferase n=1 Tax=Cohnella sp. OV330 TaxID=1855288 RepID=UPI0008EEEA2B|nr:NeuD/PglB/VioB family sugar acetyltransferase [Cohnella sp. OV330]SFB29945.1 sugar O-acyltransferase, sialic acid O-acetyltransferase NeuD family [Cohnella sp. OV330]
MENLVIFGAGGHAKSIIDIVERSGIWRIAGLLDGIKAAGTKVYGYEILGDQNYLAQDASITGVIVGIGDNWLRARAVEAIRSVRIDCRFVSAVHPHASIAKGATIGDGSVIMAGAVVSSDAVVGEHCVLYTLSSLDHDSVMENFVSLAPHAATGGNVRIGSFGAIAIGARIVHSTSIGEHTVIGAGATVLSDIGSYSIAYGTPARVIRKRTAGERYL